MLELRNQPHTFYYVLSDDEAKKARLPRLIYVSKKFEERYVCEDMLEHSIWLIKYDEVVIEDNERIHKSMQATMDFDAFNNYYSREI